MQSEVDPKILVLESQLKHSTERNEFLEKRHKETEDFIICQEIHIEFLESWINRLLYCIPEEERNESHKMFP